MIYPALRLAIRPSKAPDCYDERKELMALADEHLLHVRLGLDPRAGVHNSLGMLVSVDWFDVEESGCPECDGDGEIECCECGHISECPACDGRGKWENMTLVCSTNTWGEIVCIEVDAPGEIMAGLEVLLDAGLLRMAKEAA